MLEHSKLLHDSWLRWAAESKEDADICIMGVPFDGAVSLNAGAAQAPETLRMLSIDLSDVNEDWVPIKKGILYDIGDLPVSLQWEKYFANVEAKAYELMKAGKFCLFLGGDHSVTIPLHKAYGKYQRELKPDAVIFALGSTPIGGNLPGLQASKIGEYLPLSAKNAAIIGGGLVGCETALMLSEMGIRVDLLEMQEDIARDANPMHRVALLEKMKKAAITVHTGARCREIDGNRVLYAQNGAEKSLDAELCLLALGLRPEQEMAETLKAALPEGTETYFVGDCNRGTNIQNAVEQGYLAAMKII